MPICSDCSKLFPNWLLIDGKRRNLSSRRLCLACSPFAERERKSLYDETGHKLCTTCSRPIELNRKKTLKCQYCSHQIREGQRIEKAASIVGTACWKCGYDKGIAAWAALDFHHVDPEKKEFCLGIRQLANYAWDRVLSEMYKCVLVCCRCHREYHSGLIPSQDMKAIYDREWALRKTANPPA
jgi:hypothetical protein